MNEPLISIIVPVYKVEQYLDACIQSIVNQTYKNLEIILVDDESPDQCPQICDKWARQDSRIRVIHKQNAGVSAARNTGLEAATGRYIGFVDSDDTVCETMYAELLNAIQSSGKKIAYCASYRNEAQYAAAQQKKVRQTVLNVEDAVNGVFYHSISLSVWSKLFERQLFADIRFPEGEVNEEVPITVPLLVKAGGLVDTGRTLYYYRPREESITHSYHLHGNRCEQVCRHLELLKNQLGMYGLHCDQGYGFFAAYHAFSLSLVMERHRKSLDPDVLIQYGEYRRLMKKYLPYYLFSQASSVKNKILYCLVITRLLRPAYRVMNKQLS